MSDPKFEIIVLERLAKIEVHSKAHREKLDEFVTHQYEVENRQFEINNNVTTELRGHQGKIGRLNGEVKILIGVFGGAIGIGGIVALAKKLLG